MGRSIQIRKTEQMSIIENLKKTIDDDWKKINAAKTIILALSKEEASLMHEDRAIPIDESIRDDDTIIFSEPHALSEPPALATTDPFMIDVIGKPILPGAV